jgi:hypothetical protein
MPREQVLLQDLLSCCRQPIKALAHIHRLERQIDPGSCWQRNRHQPAAFNIVTSRCNDAPSMSAATRSRQSLASSISANTWPIAEETAAEGRGGTDNDRSDASDHLNPLERT